MKILKNMLILGIVFVASMVGFNFSVYGTARALDALQEKKAETAVEETVELSEAEGMVFFNEYGVNAAIFGSLKSRPYLNKDQVIRAILEKNATFNNALSDYIMSQKMSSDNKEIYRRVIEKQVKQYF